MGIHIYIALNTTHRPFSGSYVRIHKQQLLSIPPARSPLKPPTAIQSKDPYKVLEIAPGSSLEDIKASYYSKIKLLHPDVNENDTTEDAVLLNVAYATILQGKKLIQLITNITQIYNTMRISLFFNPKYIHLTRETYCT